jgi:hypothetical protein
MLWLCSRMTFSISSRRYTLPPIIVLKLELLQSHHLHTQPGFIPLPRYDSLYLLSQEIPCSYAAQRFITEFTKPQNQILLETNECSS